MKPSIVVVQGPKPGNVEAEVEANRTQPHLKWCSLGLLLPRDKASDKREQKFRGPTANATGAAHFATLASQTATLV
ncbi:hypothetical protein AgCh_024384 [Apium graveolens]